MKYVAEHPNFNPDYSFEENLAYLRKKDKKAAKLAAKKEKRKEEEKTGKAEDEEVQVKDEEVMVKVEEMTDLATDALRDPSVV